jgi:hypothetical protein
MPSLAVQEAHAKKFLARGRPAGTRMEKRRFDASRKASPTIMISWRTIMSTPLLPCLLAAAILVPYPALSANANRDGLRLPPIPHVETIPWLAGTTVQKTNPYLGLLLAPLPFTATPVLASVPVADRTLFATQLTTNSRVQ